MALINAVETFGPKMFLDLFIFSSKVNLGSFKIASSPQNDPDIIDLIMNTLVIEI